MSYILDALKKAEADSSPDARTALAIEQSGQRRQRWLMYTIVVALMANALILVWLFYPVGPEADSMADSLSRSTDASPVTPPPAVPGAEHSTQIPAPRASAPSSEVRPRTVVPAELRTTVATPVPDRQPDPIPRQVKLSQLPATVAARLPDIEFSTHIYADAADLRAVVINGQRLTEGDSFQALTLMEITEDGAILAFEDYLISVPVLVDWDG